MKKILVLLIICLTIGSKVIAEEKYSLAHWKTGNKFREFLSPDDKYVAFVKKSDKEAYLVIGDPGDYSPEDRLADEIWIANADGSNERLLVDMLDAPTEYPGSKQASLSLCWDLTVSDDGQKFYFMTTQWVTSCALYEVDVNTEEHRYISPANSLRVIMKGDHKGNLIIEKHKYFELGGSGSYDWLWMISPDGKELGPLGYEHELDWEQMDYFYGLKE